MKYLIQEELRFIEELKKDLEANGDKSFIEILFQASFKAPEILKQDLDELFEGYFKKLFNDSDLIFESVNCRYIGKYGDTFYGTDSEGEIFGMGQEIQNLAFSIMCSYYGDVLDPEGKIDVEKYFKNHLNLDYDEYIQSYKDFCLSLDYEYKESWDLMEKQSEEFEKELPSLE